MNLYMNRLNGARPIAFEAPAEGTPGGDPAAAAIAAAAAEAKNAEDLALAETATKKAKEDADAAALAAAGGDPEKVKLAAEKADLLKEVMDKKTKLKDSAADLAKATKQLEAYNGVDPEKVKALLKAEADAEKSALEAKGDFERVKAMMAEEHEKQVKTLQEQIEAISTARQKDISLIDDLTVGNAFGTSAYIAENLILSVAKARQLYGAHFEMKDGTVIGYDKPAGAANRTVLVNASGDVLGFEDAMTRIVDADPDKKSITKSKQKPGGSSTTTTVTPDTKSKDDGLFGRARIAASLGTM